MQRKATFFPIFLLFLFLSIIIFFFAQKGIFRGMTGFFDAATVPLQSMTFGIFQKNDENSLTEKLREENSRLINQFVKQKEIEKENKALHDQFATSNPVPKQLLPSKIIGRYANEIILDKGEHDGVKVGQIVVFKDNIVGQVSDTSIYRTVVKVLSDEKTSFTAKTVKTTASGVINGKGGDKLILDKVVLSEKLEKDDIVVTKGDVDSIGRGYPPGIVVGKIVSVNKKASSLFQAAEVVSLVDFEKLEMVFVLTGN
jgi:rod shape-determining protein MreC